MTAPRCSCNSNTFYALMRGDNIIRATYSANLVEFLTRKNPGTHVEVLDPVLGDPVTSEPDTPCLYGITRTNKPGRLLRVCVTWEEAKYLTQDPSRAIIPIWINTQHEAMAA